MNTVAIGGVSFFETVNHQSSSIESIVCGIFREDSTAFAIVCAQNRGFGVAEAA